MRRVRFSKGVLSALLASAALCLAGCPVGPNYVRPEIRTPETYRGAVTAPEAQSLANLPWWQVFGDSTLQALVQEALTSNYDLRAAVARVEQSQALVGVARSPLFPQVGYQGGAQRGKSFFVTPDNQTANVFLGSFNLAWELDVWGRIRRSTEAAQGELLASEAFRRGVMLSLVSEVAIAYFELLELDLELRIAQETVESFRDTVGLFERRFTGGVGNKLEVDRAVAALAQTEAVVPDLQRRIVATENRLSILLGRDPGPVPRGATLIEQRTPPAVPAGVPADLLERRPDVEQAEATLEAANAQVGVAVANFFPRIGLTSLYGGQSRELSDIVKSQGNIWNVAGSIAGPIFTGGQNLETYRAQVAVFEQSKALYSQSILQAFAEVSDTLTSQTKLVDIRTAREKAVAALQESVFLSLLRYNQGLSSYFEVLEAQQLLFPAQNALAAVLRDQLTVVVQLYRALGGGWELTDPVFSGGPAAAAAEVADGASSGTATAVIAPQGSPVIGVDPTSSGAAFETPRMPQGRDPGAKVIP